MAMPKGLARYWASKRRKGGKRRMARSKGYSHHRTGFTLPMGVVLGFVPLVARGIDLYKAGGAMGVRGLSKALVPYDTVTHKMDFSELGYGLWPILTGLAVHKVVGSWLGVNKALGAARVPFIRI